MTQSFESWATTADAVAATRATTRKTTLVAAYLRAAAPTDLATVTRWFTGRIFPMAAASTTGIGGAGLSRVLTRLGGIDNATLAAIWNRGSDPGATAFDVVAEFGGPPAGGVVTVTEADDLFSSLAVTPSAAREDLLLAFMTRCNAREAAAVATLLTGELRIGLREGLVEAAIATAFDAATADVARAAMVTGDLGVTAELAAAGRLGDAAPSLFVPLRFMLAHAAADAAEVVARLGDEVWVEDKYDGIRCQLHTRDGRVALYSRDLKEITTQFPDVIPGEWPEGLILDGEIIAFRDGRVLPFFALQRRLGRRKPGVGILAEFPVVYVAWDVLSVGGEVLIDMPLRERRRRLSALSLPGHVMLSHCETVIGEAALSAQFLAARARLNEGLMVKDPESPYLPGRRGHHWIKMKRPLDTLDVVVVGAEYGHGKRHGVLSDVTFAVRGDDGTLATVGKVYTGLSDVEIAEMTALLHDLSTAQHGRYHSVEPRIVLEIAFDSIQASTRHRSGYALRFPRIVRWRRDKGPDDIDTLERVAAIATARAAEFTQRVDPAGEGTPG